MTNTAAGALDDFEATALKKIVGLVSPENRSELRNSPVATRWASAIVYFGGKWSPSSTTQ